MKHIKPSTKLDVIGPAILLCGVWALGIVFLHIGLPIHGWITLVGAFAFTCAAAGS